MWMERARTHGSVRLIDRTGRPTSDIPGPIRAPTPYMHAAGAQWGLPLRWQCVVVPGRMMPTAASTGPRSAPASDFNILV